MAAQAAPTNATELEAQVVGIIRELLLEQGKTAAAERVRPDASFQKDLGLASLDLVELVVRCEARLDVPVPDDITDHADTPGTWARAMFEGDQETASRSSYRIVPPSKPPLVPVGARTVVEALLHHAECDPGRVHIHFFEKGAGQGISYGWLAQAAGGVARGLKSLGLEREDAVGILLPNCTGFFPAFLGVMMAGGVPVPVYPPAVASRIAEYVRRQARILEQAGVRYLISFPEVQALSNLLQVNVPGLREVVTVEQLRESGGLGPPVLAAPAALALVEHTSGSTGDPKGVMVRHENLMANLRGIGGALSVGPDDSIVSWLPLASDLGLSANWLFCLYHGIPLTQLCPQDFLDRPESWFWAMHDARGTLAAAPNFAYDLCARRIPAWTLEGIDLSCWRVAVNAGEEVLPETVRRFARRFQPFGFRPESMLPCYGLAECTVALAIPPAGREPVIDRVSRATLQNRGVAEAAAHAGSGSVEFFSVGRPLPGHEVRIVDAANRPAGERQQGRLQFRGPSRVAGYWNDPVATAEAISEDGWMESGDQAYEAGGEIYITGRIKDAILKAGRCIAPAELEAAVGDAPGVKKDGVAAFGVAGPKRGAERLVIVAETTAVMPADLARVRKEIETAVRGLVGFAPDSIELIPPDCLPKTSNGKLRRHHTMTLYSHAELRKLGGPVWWQVARLRLQHFPQLVTLGARRGVNGSRRLAVGAVVNLIGYGAGLAARVTGSRSWIRAGAKALVKVTGQRVSISGGALGSLRGPVVLMANRAGLYDPLILMAALPSPAVLAGGEALMRLPGWCRYLLAPQAVGTANGGRTPEGGEVRQQAREALSRGDTVVLFSDGPLATPIERCRFRLHALHAAAEAGAAVLPVAFRERTSAEQPARLEIEVLAGSPVTAGGCPAAELREQLRGTISTLYA